MLCYNAFDTKDLGMKYFYTLLLLNFNQHEKEHVATAQNLKNKACELSSLPTRALKNLRLPAYLSKHRLIMNIYNEDEK